MIWKKDKWPQKLIIFSEKLPHLDQITLKIWHFWKKMLSTSLKISVDNSERKHKKSKQQNVSCWSFSGSVKKQGHSNIVSSLLHFVEISQLSTYEKLQIALKIVVLTLHFDINFESQSKLYRTYIRMQTLVQKIRENVGGQWKVNFIS